MTERTRIFAIAHVVPGLEQAWLQHARDFDITWHEAEEAHTEAWDLVAGVHA